MTALPQALKPHPKRLTQQAEANMGMPDSDVPLRVEDSALIANRLTAGLVGCDNSIDCCRRLSYR